MYLTNNSKAVFTDIEQSQEALKSMGFEECTKEQYEKCVQDEKLQHEKYLNDIILVETKLNEIGISKESFINFLRSC